MAHLVETMAYAGQTPWHELGHALPAKQSIDVWAQAAGMDWRIQETPVRYLATEPTARVKLLVASVMQPMADYPCWAGSQRRQSRAPG